MSQILKPKKGYKSIPWLFGKEIEIPKEWNIKTIDNVCDFLISGTNSRSDLNENGEIYYIHYGDIHTKWNLVLDCDLEEIPRIDKEKVSKLPLLKEGDLVIADASEDVEGSGTSVTLKNVKNKKIVAGLHTIVLRNKDEDVSSDYLKYLTSINSVKIQIISFVTGSKVFGLSKNNCKPIRVPFPKLKEQQKIASILSNIEELITVTQKAIDDVQLLKAALIQWLPITGIGHTKFKEPQFKPRFVKYKIPQAWDVSDLKSISTKIADIDHKMPKKTTEGIKFIAANNLNGNEIDFENTEFISKDDYLYHSKKFNAEKNDILISRIGSIGVARIICTDEPFIASYSVALIKPKKDVDSKFLEYYLNSILPQTVMKAYTIVSGNVNLVLGELGKVPVLLPPFQEQQKIASILSNVDNIIKSHDLYQEKLQNLRKSLIQKLLTGEVRVKI